MVDSLAGFVAAHRRSLLLLGCALLVLGLWALQVDPYLNAADDSGRYMVLGESLARTGDLRLLNSVHHLRDTLYVPGFPGIIAFWMLVTGRDPGGVVILVKLTQVLLLIGMLPLLASLLERARLPFPAVAVALVTFSLCPSMTGYANEVMSEIPLTFLCLAAVVLVERDPRPDHDGDVSPPWKRVVALGCALTAFLVRAVGIVMIGTLVVWYWRRFGWKWGALAAVAGLLLVGGWTARNKAIIRHDPPNTHDTYIHQFTLRDPSNLKAGRIKPNALGLLERLQTGVPAYIGMIPRAMLHVMSLGSPVWSRLFWLLAIPLGALILAGFAEGTRRGLLLTGGFCALFWLFAALWPWRSARFLVPLVPFMIVYLFLAVERLSEWLQARAGRPATRLLQAAGLALLLSYFLHVQKVAIAEGRHPTLAGYALGRTKQEAGFYAACAWLRQNGAAGDVVMGRPAYLLHLYSGHPAIQIDPSENTRVQEQASMKPNHVAYLLYDTWSWAHTARYLHPYLSAYGDKWTLAWTDPNGSRVRIFKRIAP